MKCILSGVAILFFAVICQSQGALISGFDFHKDSSRIADYINQSNWKKDVDSISQDSLCRVYFTLANGYFKVHKFQQARDLLKRCFEAADQLEDRRLVAECSFLRGEMAMEEDDRAFALEDFSKALMIYRQQSDSINYLKCLRKIGSNYDYLGDHSLALEYYHECVDLSKKLERSDLLAAALNNIAGVYDDDGDYQKAIQIYDEAIGIALDLSDFELQCIIYANLSLSYRRQGKYGDSRKAIIKTLGISRAHDDVKSIGFAYQSLGYLYLETGDLDSSAFYMQKTRTIANSIKNAQLEGNAMDVLQQIYYRTGRYKEAYDLYSLMESREDSLFNLKNTELIESIRAKYQSAKKENEMVEKNLQLQQADATLTRHRHQQLILIVVVLLLLVIIFLIFRGFIIRERNNEALIAKNSEIEKHAWKVEQLNATKNRWFINVAHELRTPLTLIKGPVHRLLKREGVPSDMVSDILLIDRNAKTLSMQVNEMLDLSKMEEGEITLKESVFELNQLMKDVVSIFESRASKMGLNFHFESQEAFFMMADRDKLYKILINLISNALKFTSKEGSVILGFKMSDCIEIKVADSGRGISKEDLPYVFERFYQSANPENILQGGTGIGLALSKEIAEMHGGELKVTSKPGEGSTFTLMLPRELKMPDQAPAIVGKSNDVSEPLSLNEGYSSLQQMERKPLLLLVDDHDDMRQYVCSLLEDVFQIKEARTGQEGLNILGASDIKLIISDVMMPEMDGVTFLKKVKADPLWKHLPFIHLSAIADDEMRKDSFRIGIDDYLVKPFDPEELIIRVSNLYNNYAKRIATDSEEDLVSYDDTVIRRLKKEVLDSLGDHGFNVFRLADAAAMSERQLYRYLKGASGLTPLQFIQEIKLNKAHELARKKIYGSTSELAWAVGFKQASYFASLFEKRFGKKPSSIIKG